MATLFPLSNLLTLIEASIDSCEKVLRWDLFARAEHYGYYRR